MSNYRQWSKIRYSATPVYSVIIPAYNEAIRIVPTIGAIASELCEQDLPWELIVSDDGSTDETVTLVEDLHLPNLRLLVSANTGKGGAVRRGMQAARGRYLLFADADQSTPIEQFHDLVNAINDGADVAVGSRAGAEANVQGKSRMRSVVSSGLNLLVRNVFRVPVRDTQCGFKMFTAEAAKVLFAEQRLDGFSFDFELLWLARRHGMTVAEVPVEWIDAPGSSVDPLRDSIQFLRDLAQIAVWSVSGGYQAAPDPSTPDPLQEAA